MRVKDMKSVCSQKEAEIFRQRCFGRQLLLPAQAQPKPVATKSATSFKNSSFFI